MERSSRALEPPFTEFGAYASVYAGPALHTDAGGAVSVFSSNLTVVDTGTQFKVGGAGPFLDSYSERYQVVTLSYDEDVFDLVSVAAGVPFALRLGLATFAGVGDVEPPGDNLGNADFFNTGLFELEVSTPGVTLARSTRSRSPRRLAQRRVVRTRARRPAPRVSCRPGDGNARAALRGRSAGFQVAQGVPARPSFTTSSNSSSSRIGVGVVTCRAVERDAAPLLYGLVRPRIRDGRVVDVLDEPTRYDPFANACLEAMASGLAVATTPDNGIADLLASGENGFVFAGDFGPAFALLDDPARLAAVGAAALYERIAA
jgi:hypothetical protein